MRAEGKARAAGPCMVRKRKDAACPKAPVTVSGRGAVKGSFRSYCGWGHEDGKGDLELVIGVSRWGLGIIKQFRKYRGGGGGKSRF